MVEKTLEPQHREWLEARKISVDLAATFGLHSTVQSFPSEEGWEKAKAISVPYLERGKVINHKHRRASTKQHVMDKGAKLGLWNGDVLREPSTQPVVITEGEWDALTALQCGWSRATSVPNGAPTEATDDPANAKRYEYLWDYRDEIAKVDRFILATDSDPAGIALRSDLIALLGPARCSFVEYPDGCKDLNDVLVKLGPEDVTACLNGARGVPVDGLHRITDFPDVPPLAMKPILGVTQFDDMFGLTPGTFTVITGYPGHGKSSLVIKMIANLIASQTQVTIGSFETLPRPILERRMMAALDERAEHDPTIWKNDLAKQILHDRLTVIANTPDEQHELGFEMLLELMEASVMRHGTKLVVIDPWNEIEHKRQRDETETDYISRAIRGIKRFCHRTQTAVWVVSHPRKPSSDGNPKHPPSLYDLSGSANWYNKADYGLVVHRPNLTGNDVDIVVPKVRMGLPGRCGRVTLRFDPSRSRYVEAPL